MAQLQTSAGGCHCGVEAFAQGNAPKTGAPMALNLGCLDGFDVDSVPVRRFDGVSL